MIKKHIPIFIHIYRLQFFNHKKFGEYTLQILDIILLYKITFSIFNKHIGTISYPSKSEYLLLIFLQNPNNSLMSLRQRIHKI